MPEFILDTSNAAKEWRDLSDFAKGFIEAMYFCDQSPAYDMADWFSEETQEAVREGQSDGEIPSDAGVEHLHPDAIRDIAKFCEAFETKAADLLAKAYDREDYDSEQAGRDLYFTYAGHGVGYWSREQLEAEGLGEALSTACGRGEVCSFFGGHVEHGDAPFVHVSVC
ncbi:hypothetical protein HDIA_0728 [Hartmannibacter diazotrophicus]|uniref:Uncharacterized protein n=1 Tax=Hartmannibacter diazotrophicus TaxID=1482074 RepID=A0A2C9D281_9HYPH|nr:hypothetical protein [Hartmannibacter diazotrophicus]SON54269.1 hypothetical protein HDIA_0728 [Hartmannibacter diazotrophicus]